MGQYDFQCPRTGRVITLYQSMGEEHKFVDDEGVEWNRIFYKPNAIIDSIYNIDPRDKRKFVERTGRHKGKLKDIYQLSAELSERRADRDGFDVIKERCMDNYEQSRPNTRHPLRKQKELKENLGKLGVEIVP